MKHEALTVITVKASIDSNPYHAGSVLPQTVDMFIEAAVVAVIMTYPWTPPRCGYKQGK